MVKVSLWLSMADKQKTKTGLPLSGPDTDINVSSIHTVGYLGKFSEITSVSLQEYCPTCATKGEKKALRRYYISLEESILLCENPQCVFPLGCKPLNEILISPTLPRPSNNAVKSTCGPGSLIPLCKRNVKRQKTSNCNNKDIWNGFTDAPKDVAFQPLENSLNKINSFVPCSENGSSHKSVNSGERNGMVVPDKPILMVPGQLCGKRKEPPTEFDQTRLEVPNEGSQIEQLFLQWKNTSALCWLDCILTALVHLKVIREVMSNLGTEMESPVKKLCTEYDQACALISNCQSKGNGLRKIPRKTHAQIELLLNNVRESLFQLLQPKLKCELGVPDSPVFAFPHLLQQDPYVEELFMQSYIWSFECMKCGYKYDERCMKTLTTFTKIVSDWHPLNAIHKSPCNKCQDEDQRRKMLLDRVSSLYMLHFVDGLPHTDLDTYRFDFQGNSYRICTIIQYLQAVKHFVTWIQNPDGSWLECDDLKGSSSCRHSTLKVSAHEVHIVVWEKSDLENTTQSSNMLPFSNSSSVTCINTPTFKSDDTSFVSQLLCETSLNSPIQLSPVKKPMFSTFAEVTAPNINCVKENEQGILNSNLLSGLEHLADDAMVTLNLVEIKVDSEGNPINNNQFIPSVEQCDLQRQKTLPLQNSSLATQMTVDHIVPVQPFAEEQYSNEICQQMDQIVKPEVPQKYILQSEAPSWSPRTSQQQATDAAGVNPTMLQKDAAVKKLTMSPAACPMQEIETTSVGSEIQSCRKTQKKSPIKIPASRMLKTSTINGSPAEISRPLAANRSFAVGWTKSLLNRHLSTLASNEPRILPRNEVKNAHKGNALLKVTDPKHPIKEHFDGFKTKYLSKYNQRVKKLPSSQDSNIPNVACVQNANHLPPDSGIMKENYKVLLSRTASSGVHTLNKAFFSNSSKCGYPTMYETGTTNMKKESSDPVKKTELNHLDSKAHGLRLKLLKKLQVKKDQLASLDQLMKTKQYGEFATEYVSTSSLEGQLNIANDGSTLYDDVLNELWRELGVEDSKSVCTTSSSASLSSSPSHDELLAELFIPATTTISNYMQSDDLRLSGVSADGAANCKLSNGCTIDPRTANGDHPSPISALQMEHHAYKNESISVTNTCASVYESPTKEEMLVDLLSTSTLNSLAGDHEDELPNFDENLFENC
ncbi:SUMO-specific isopeptidase USPL1 isoform X1 [Carcharodon carcharias]|uniref:SUMO-specific isopeptidase USPL1 isoform X1 n=1 Tax=Carcharodon carcharias TaxID=13397 RepID=UPI001B7E30E5|nr:SUMO-specific isopeptidase USPL1 isoform X1 [Carcharodon carcharias]XP_041054717.1 SUMO-specific isopeptidase USPL1 isoform X1 [Carcharodon carcharias]XP_041054718.1 SUMO-specific isopeptidase USPL1 isoform X1 [Carcharodon carcharias]XP_041054719.1 SUMO-specific isopeptidase USPL1 isoform X1 [Carcharodon carcharias]